MTAELLEVAGIHVKRSHKRRVTPSFIKEAILNDEEMKKTLNNVTIRLA